MRMKKTIYLYSRSSEPEEHDPTVPPKDPTVVNIRDLCVPLDETVSVTLGHVEASTCKWLVENRFDQVPVAVPSADIGWRLVDRKTLEQLALDGRPLTDDPVHFLPNDICEIPSFGHPEITELLDALATAPAVLTYGVTYLSPGFAGAEPDEETQSIVIYGLVTRSDLNTQPVRLATYDYLVRLERGLAHLVSATFDEPWDWIRKLSEEKQARILGYMDLSQRRGVEHEPIAAAMLPELFNVIAATPDLLGRLEFRSSKECDKLGRRIASIRNRVMHPVRPLVLGEEDVYLLREVVRSAEELSRRVESAVCEIARRSES